MRRLFFIVIAAFLFGSCASTLYNWGGESSSVSDYEKLTYNYYDKQTPESLCQLLAMYEEIISRPNGSRHTPPPGICAEYGYLLLMPGTVETFEKYATSHQRALFSGTDYGTIFHERGIEMLKEEIRLYPESEKFITPLIKRF